MVEALGKGLSCLGLGPAYIYIYIYIYIQELMGFFFFFLRESQPMVSARDNSSFIIRPRY